MSTRADEIKIPESKYSVVCVLFATKNLKFNLKLKIRMLKTLRGFLGKKLDKFHLSKLNFSKLNYTILFPFFSSSFELVY